MLYKQIARLINARENCIKMGKEGYQNYHIDSINKLIEEYMPSGSGIDNGVQIDLDKSTEDKLVFHFGYHFMNDVGMYDGWEDYTLIVTPSLSFDFNVKIIGKNRNDIKDYLYDTFHCALKTQITNT